MNANRTSEKDTVFVFTKLFPYGSSEQYLADELPFLADSFRKVVLVPCELFQPYPQNVRALPANCEVLLLNEEGRKQPARRKWGELFSVFFCEWMRARSKSWFWKERKRYFSVLLNQSHLATVFSSLLATRYAQGTPVFYAYWIHNSSIMLGLMKRRGAIEKFICRGHSIDLYEWDWALTRYIKVLPFYHFIIRQATTVAAISQHGADHLSLRFPVMREKFICSRLGVDALGVNPFGPQTRFTVVSCSNFSDNKRVDAIASVIAAMQTPVRWIHFGDGKGREKIEAIVRTFPPHASAELRGFTPNTQIKEFYGAETVNIFINLSEAEGIPVSLMEAISFGIPVLATAVYGNPEIAVEQTGFLVDVHSSPAAVARQLDAFANDPGQQARIRHTAREFHKERFDAAANYTSFARLLHTVG